MLQTPSYHLAVSNYFKAHPKTWEFFASYSTKQEQLQAFKMELLKNTYQFDPASDQQLYEKVQTAKEKLGLENLQVSVYQAQFSDEMNATIVYLDNEAHIVFSGRMVQLLDEEELLAVIAHELTHVKLYTMQNGELEIADRIITAIANNYQSEAAYLETARLFRLYTEVYCDRGAYSVVGKTGPVITSLVKIATGLEKVSATSYVKQAEEIFSSSEELKANSLTHPENFIRARAVQLWHDRREESDKAIEKMIEGRSTLDELDIFRQKELAQRTRQLLQILVKPKWFQTVLVMSLARQYFPDFILDDKAVLTNDFSEFLALSHASIRDYFSCVLLDFALVDASLESIPFGWAYQLAEDLHLKESFDQLVKKELKFSDKKLSQHREKVLAAYYEVKESAGEQIYED
jgi:Zn-dependent protease with chaperone function